MRDPLDWLSVRYKLALMFVGVVFIAFGVGGYFVSTSARDTLEQEILLRVRSQARASGRALDAHVYCMDDAERPTRDQAIVLLVEWSNANPQHDSLEAVDGVLQWAVETYPCGN